MFHNLKKNKGKTRNKPAESEVELSTADPELLSNEEVNTLIESLNEDTHKTKEVVAVVDKAIEIVVKEQEAKAVNQGKTFEAFGLCYNDKARKFMKVLIEYNPETGFTKMISVEPYADSAPTALNKLNKILSLRMIKKEEVY